MRILVDAELVLSAFYQNKYTKDAETLLAGIMPSKQIELYITELCLDKIRYYDECTAKIVAEKFRSCILPYNNCSIKRQVIDDAEYTRDFECAIETSWALTNNIGTIVTHKPQDFLVADLLVWAVNDLLAIVSCNELVYQTLLQSSVCTNIQESTDLANTNLKTFNARLVYLLYSESPSKIAILAFIKRSLKQFDLLNCYSAYEVLSEAFIRGVEQIKRGEDITNPLAWIRVTSFNIIKEYSRQSRRFYQLENCVIIDSKDSSLVDIEETYEDDIRKVKLAFEKLDNDEKEILILKIYEQLTWAEILQSLEKRGIKYQSEAALRKRKERALKRLRQYYSLIQC